MGALPLFFEERPGGRSPSDRGDLAIPHDDPLDQDPAELLLPGRRRHSDRLGQCEKARPVDIEGSDPVIIWQRREGRPNRIPLGLVLGVAQVAPAVLLSELLEAGEEPRPLPARDHHRWGFETPAQLDPGRVDLPYEEGRRRRRW